MTSRFCTLTSKFFSLEVMTSWKFRSIENPAWRPLRAIAAKRCKIEPKLLLITIGRISAFKWHENHLPWMIDLEGQYCNRNCIGCSVFFRARRFYCEKYLQNLRLIFPLFIFSLSLFRPISPGEMTIAWNSSYLYRLAKWPRPMSVILAFIVAFETAFR